jgi:hypothetical protein
MHTTSKLWANTYAQTSTTCTTRHNNLNLIGLCKAEKAFTGNNALIIAQMVHDQWLGKRMVSFLMLPERTGSPCITHHHALAVKNIWNTRKVQCFSGYTGCEHNLLLVAGCHTGTEKDHQILSLLLFIFSDDCSCKWLTAKFIILLVFCSCKIFRLFFFCILIHSTELKWWRIHTNSELICTIFMCKKQIK